MLKAGLLGSPIEHSLSPAIHTAAYQELGLDWEYALYPCADVATFEAQVDVAMRDPEAWVGFNITTPYKKDAYRIAQMKQRAAKVCLNANVLTCKYDSYAHEYRSYGDSTDGLGIVGFLEGAGGVELKGAVVLLCGSGPTALSALYALSEAQVASIKLLSRDAEQASVQATELLRRLGELRYRECATSMRTVPATMQLAELNAMQERYSKLPPLPSITAHGYDDAEEVFEGVYTHEGSRVLIDATSVGMHTGDEPVIPVKLLRPELAVLDVVYGHPTSLVEHARAVGALAFDGLGMLVEQAALTIEDWAAVRATKTEAPRAAMRAAAEDALAKRGIA
jgi:shikimate dehydrogenase